MTFGTRFEPMKILVIDDDVLLCRAITRMLMAEGHDVVTAHDGSRGMKMFRREKPEVVITDTAMADQTGIETIFALRRDDSRVKIIAIAGADSEVFETARLIGADDVIEKPFRGHELLARVRAL
jgi:DNA-binding response OmpR family regulator